MEATHYTCNNDLTALEESIFSNLKASHPSSSTALVSIALDIAQTWHGSDVRASGEPFVTHPKRVAAGLAALGYCQEIVAAGALHDVLEDTSLSLSALTEMVGPEVAHLVSVLTKDPSLEKAGREPAAMRKLAGQMLMHPCLFTIKVLDRMDNLATLAVFRKEKQQRILEATHHYFSPALKAANLESLSRWILFPPCIQHPLEFIQEVSILMSAWPTIFYDLTLSDGQISRDPILRSVSNALEKAATDHA